MIKVIGVFDKVKQQKIGANLLQDFIIEEIARIDFDQLPCPVCSGKNPVWKYLRSREHAFIWDDPDHEIQVPMPHFSFCCKVCGARGNENVSTDLTIDKTRLSYRFVFGFVGINRISRSFNRSFQIFRRRIFYRNWFLLKFPFFGFTNMKGVFFCKIPLLYF